MLFRSLLALSSTVEINESRTSDMFVNEVLNAASVIF